MNGTSASSMTLLVRLLPHGNPLAGGPTGWKVSRWSWSWWSLCGC